MSTQKSPSSQKKAHLRTPDGRLSVPNLPTPPVTPSVNRREDANKPRPRPRPRNTSTPQSPLTKNYLGSPFRGPKISPLSNDSMSGDREAVNTLATKGAPSSDVIEINSSSGDSVGEEEMGTHKAPGEKWVYGRSKHSRVKIKEEDMDPDVSPHRTRSWRAKMDRPPSPPDESVHARATRNQNTRSHTTVKKNSSTERKGLWGDLDPSDDDDLPEASVFLREWFKKPSDTNTQDINTPGTPIAKGTVRPPKRSFDRFASNESPVPEREGKKPKKARLQHSQFLDVEAAVDPPKEYEESSSEDGRTNEYDHDDPFIDDSEILGRDYESQDPGEEDGSASKERMDSDKDESALLSEEDLDVDPRTLKLLLKKLRPFLKTPESASSMVVKKDVLKLFTHDEEDIPSRRLRGAPHLPPSDNVHLSNPITPRPGKGKAREVVHSDEEDPVVYDGDGEMDVDGYDPEEVRLAMHNSKINNFMRESVVDDDSLIQAGTSSQAGVPASKATLKKMSTSSENDTAKRISDAAPTPRSVLTMKDLMQRTDRVPEITSLVPSNEYAVVLVPEASYDEVFDPSLVDVFLKDDYGDLTCLRKHVFKPAVQSRGGGQPFFRVWGEISPDLNATLALQALRFQDSGAYINPSRAGFNNVQLREVPARSPRYHLMRNERNLYCVSSGFVSQCNLVVPTNYGMKVKSISIAYHQLEWGRMQGWTGETFVNGIKGKHANISQVPLEAQIFRGALEFATKAPEKSEGAALFGASSVPEGGGVPKTVDVPKDAFALPCEVDIPIFDGRRSSTFNFNHDLPHLESKLPPYNGGDLPEGSYAVVGYTMGVYLSKDKGWSAIVAWAVRCTEPGRRETVPEVLNKPIFIVVGFPSSFMAASNFCQALCATNVAMSLQSAKPAAFSVRAASSRLSAYHRSFDGHHVLCQFGGGARKKYVHMDDLAMVVDHRGQPLNLTSTQYDLVSHVRANLVNNELASHPDSIACDLPMAILLKHLNVDELRDVCKMHNIKTTSLHIRAALINDLTKHECDVNCARGFTILSPFNGQERGFDRNVLDLEDPAFLNTINRLPRALVEPLLPGDCSYLSATEFVVTDVKRNPPPHHVSGNTSFLLANIDISFLLYHLTVTGIKSLAAAHGIFLPSNTSKAKWLSTMENHKRQCRHDIEIYIVVTPFIRESKSSKQRQSKTAEDTSSNDKEKASFLWESYVPIDTDIYPPRPTTMKDVSKAIEGFCNDTRPGAVEEEGCAVCGQLTKTLNLSMLEDVSDKLDLLKAVGVARGERTTLSQPVEFPGDPVLVPGLTKLCQSCKTSLNQGKRPRMALANNLWLGEVPEELKDLTLAEQTLISRVRHTRCMVRVSNGHSKMIANVIAFEHPSMKVYNALPIARKDLDEVLAVIFTGATPPSADDLIRTPALVRRNKVKKALEWLKLNNAQYHDLIIDYETLDTYGLNHVPVDVLHKQTATEEGNVPAEAMSQFDIDNDIGTSSGPCPFTVNGLSTDQCAIMTSTQRKAAAVQHIMNGGSFLAVGHDATPQSLYNNPSLYPAMFPWLFPYGHGALGHKSHFGLISKENHLKWLLMYHDKRFQVDGSFVIVAFNHQLIKQGTSGSFMLVKRRNFAKVAETIQTISPGVLKHITERLRHGGRFTPSTNEEKKCYSLLDQIEYVGSHVDGSMASRKYMRNELWSFVSYIGAPQWFITLSPADNKNPLCIYMASQELTFRPDIKGYSERQHLVTRNPVACARFFHEVVSLFLKHVVGWDENQIKHGLFGKPAGYYGTVEQQGRMTLHLHCLLWIEGALSPLQIRERLMSGDSDFQKDLVAYLESCRVGEFLTGTFDEVSKRVPLNTDKKDKGIHSVPVEDETNSNVPIDYVDPTLTMPEPPPPTVCEGLDGCGCTECKRLTEWYSKFCFTVDDIVRRSNVHRCFGRKDNDGSRDDSNATKKKHSIPKRHVTGKGCINNDGVCTARFPRETYLKTMVDLHTGRIDLKKHESMINDITPAIVAMIRCNTDTTSLLSGTALKAILGYITDYITKGSLKTYQIFSTMYDTFTRSPASESVESKPGNAARRMVVRIVNSLSAKMEMGGPMAALYLLKNPDRYCSHEFRVFYWKNYFNFVVDVCSNSNAKLDTHTKPGSDAVREHIGISQEVKLDSIDKKDEDEATVQIGKSGGCIIGKSNTDEYRFRPREHEPLSLYEWIQCSMKAYDSELRPPKKTLAYYPYIEGHPQRATHSVACDLERRHYVVPNFVGPPLPRKDSGADDEYFLAMLVLFKPWRTGLDLKDPELSWEDAFYRHDFTSRERQIMNHFNIRFECYDARDDFAAILKKASPDDSDEENDDSDDDHDGAGVDDDWMDGVDCHENQTVGPAYQKAQERRREVVLTLMNAGWNHSEIITHSIKQFKLPHIALDKDLEAGSWRRILDAEKDRLFKAKYRATGVQLTSKGGKGKVINDAYVVPGSYLTKDFVPSNPEWSTVINKIAADYSLNDDQKRAYKIIANHATAIAPTQLLMHLGGMGGTGKSRVITALESYFGARGEPSRLALLGPTGTSSALIGGTTYHSFLGLRTGEATGEGSRNTLDNVLERLASVGYIFIDECSMLSCRDLCRISARLCEVLQVYEKPFGGLNVILAGDFAQLPPVGGMPLFSREATVRQAPRTKAKYQESTIGRVIWLQFTTVVMLKENMRQKGKHADEVAFQDALVRLRYRDCSDADIQLIKSRVAGTTPELSIDSSAFKNVPVITRYNAVKDELNDTHSERFAKDFRSTLHDFYSMDKITDPPQTREDMKKVWSGAKTLTTGLREALWHQPPNTSEQIPSCLRLAIGMPVIIRQNIATELCITRGQEARVVGWSSVPIKAAPTKRMLEVLYLELVNAPRQIKVPNLPLNVVPLTTVQRTVAARLPSDEYLAVQRVQVPVLPNFAITDYSSQGKTRPANVVDITESKNFHAVYTALSRGTTLKGTLILRPFPTDNLVGGIDGELRQEYRDLDELNIITELQFRGILPVDFAETTRWATIDKFRQWAHNQANLEENVKLHVQKKDFVPRGEVLPELNTIATTKRKKDSDENGPRKRARTKKSAQSILSTSPWLLPIGPRWDSVDHSCAYDALLFVLYWLWFSDEEKWSDVWTSVPHGLPAGKFTLTRTRTRQLPVPAMAGMGKGG